MSSRKAKERRPGRLEQALGWLGVLLVLCIWPAVRVHEASAQHAVCAEHGEVIDLHEVESHPAEAPTGEHLRSGSGGEEGHAHCPFLVLAQPSEPPGETPPACLRLVEQAHVASSGSEVALASIPLLCLAPKQSPPV